MARAVIEKKSSSDAVKQVLNGEKPTKKKSTSNSDNNKKKALNENTKTSNNTKTTKKETKETKSERKNQMNETIESKEVIEAKEAKDRTSPQLSTNKEENNSLKQSKQELLENGLNGNIWKPESVSDGSPKSHNKDDDTNDQYLQKQTKLTDLNTNGLAESDQKVAQKPEVDQIKTVRPKNAAKTTLPTNLTQNSGNYLNVWTNRFFI